jgi:hypothetical protein
MINRCRKAMYGGHSWKQNVMSVPGLEASTLSYPADLRPLAFTTWIGNVRMDTGVAAVLHANDNGGPTVLWGGVRRVRA